MSQCLLDLTTIPNRTRMQDNYFIEDLQRIHKLTHDHLVALAAKYKLMVDHHRRHVEFAIGDKVWAILTKDRFPLHEYNKLKA